MKKFSELFLQEKMRKFRFSKSTFAKNIFEKWKYSNIFTLKIEKISFFKISIFSTSHMIFQWFFEMNIFHDIFDFFLSKSFKKFPPKKISCKYNFLNFQYFLKRLKILTSPSPLVSTKMRLCGGGGNISRRADASKKVAHFFSKSEQITCLRAPAFEGISWCRPARRNFGKKGYSLRCRGAAGYLARTPIKPVLRFKRRFVAFQNIQPIQNSLRCEFIFFCHLHFLDENCFIEIL